MNNELTFEEFSERLNNMNKRCSSCKYFKRNVDNSENSFCSKLNITRSYDDERCDKWRYFA